MSSSLSFRCSCQLEAWYGRPVRRAQNRIRDISHSRTPRPARLSPAPRKYDQPCAPTRIATAVEQRHGTHGGESIEEGLDERPARVSRAGEVGRDGVVHSMNMLLLELCHASRKGGMGRGWGDARAGFDGFVSFTSSSSPARPASAQSCTYVCAYVRTLIHQHRSGRESPVGGHTTRLDSSSIHRAVLSRRDATRAASYGLRVRYEVRSWQALELQGRGLMETDPIILSSSSDHPVLLPH